MLKHHSFYFMSSIHGGINASDDDDDGNGLMVMVMD